ncbi:hypothetical protein SORBI_3006G269101 [Sorghum bicolor]|uniref:Uncharacterized protein n=1 Tax=Sorghum bicolor TaxID=4558 RepID=A0A1Z5RG62_SORBI|nr:hypothetical protein SORBI_3006G269101 [Sorghum bicolor]
MHPSRAAHAVPPPPPELLLPRPRRPPPWRLLPVPRHPPPPNAVVLLPLLHPTLASTSQGGLHACRSGGHGAPHARLSSLPLPSSQC